MSAGRVIKINSMLMEEYGIAFAETSGWCATTTHCGGVGLCCKGAIDSCRESAAYALRTFGIKLPEVPDGGYATNGPCTIPPHLRPHCTTWTCGEFVPSNYKVIFALESEKEKLVV